MSAMDLDLSPTKLGPHTWEEFLELDEDFHLKIAEAAHLPILYGVLSQLRGFVRVARLGTDRPETVLTEVTAEHGSLIDALERRDAAEAVAVLLVHLNKTDYGEERS